MIQCTCPNPAMLYSVPMCGTHLLRIKSKDTFVWVVESCSFSYQRYASVIKGHTIRELCFCIAIELPKGTKNLVVLADSIFEKKLF